MIPLWREKGYSFDFDEARKVERIHLQGAPLGASVNLFRKPFSGEGPATVSGVVCADGWVKLEKILITAPGDRFVAFVSDPGEKTGNETQNASVLPSRRENR